MPPTASKANAIAFGKPAGSNMATSIYQLGVDIKHQLTIAQVSWHSQPMVDKNALRAAFSSRSEEHTSELQSQFHLVCRLLLEKKKKPPHQLYDSSRPIQ